MLMIVIFGWTTKGSTERPLIDTHCYRCGRQVTWHLYRATEWFTAFFVPVLPIKNEHSLMCQDCGDRLQVTKDEMREIKQLKQLPTYESRALHDALVRRLEDTQLAGKTETQREWLKNRR